MAKLVAYSVVERKNLQNPDAPSKFYAQAQAKGTIDLDDMCDRIEEKCSLHASDVLAVFKAIEKEVVDSLERGEIVQLGGLGTFQIGITGKGADSREEYKSHLIESIHLNYRPGKKFFALLNNVEFQKVTRRGKLDVVVPLEEEDDGDDSTGGESVDPLA